jgi:hypothetical protein
MITGYLEIPIGQAREQREAHGREYARERGLPWPMPPDRYGPGRQPANRAAHYQRHEAGIIEDRARGAALLLVTAAMESRTGTTVQVDGEPVRLADTRTKYPTTEPLPTRWREVLDPSRATTATSDSSGATRAQRQTR